MKIAILTRTSTNNYGTVLQGFALCRFLTKNGFQASIVDDNYPRVAFKPQISKQGNQSIKGLLYRYFDSIQYNAKRIRQHYIQYRIRQFNKSISVYRVHKDIEELNDVFDGFISGSDQIWANTAEPTLYPYFMQCFVSRSKLRVSYAVSIGNSFSDDIAGKVRSYINGFNYVSVREPSSANHLKQIGVTKEIRICCDPVLLFDRSFWNSISRKRIIKGKYIFCYFLTKNEWYVKTVQDVADQLQCNVAIYYANELKKGFHGLNSPESFISMIQYAEFVITDSYHATLFSIIFKKGFYTLKRFHDESNNTQNGRLTYLLNRLGLKNRMITNDQRNTDLEIDYNYAEEEIVEFRNESSEFLITALKAGKSDNKCQNNGQQ